MNHLLEHAKKHGRSLVTPDDVTACLQKYPTRQIRRYLLMLIAAEHPIENLKECARLAAQRPAKESE